MRDGQKAAVLAGRAVQLTARQDVISLDTLAAANAEIGRFDQAVAIDREAIALARAQGNDRILPELSARLAIYEKGVGGRLRPPTPKPATLDLRPP